MKLKMQKFCINNEIKDAEIVASIKEDAKNFALIKDAEIFASIKDANSGCESFVI
jgi:hypothetical protein